MRQEEIMGRMKNIKDNVKIVAQEVDSAKKLLCSVALHLGLNYEEEDNES